MTSPLSATELDIAALLGTEPALLDSAVPWFYNKATYLVTRGAATLRIEIQPSSRDIAVELRIDGLTVYELDAHGVDDIRVHRDPRNRVVEIAFSAVNSVWIRVDPRIAVYQTCDDRSLAGAK